MRKYHFYKQHDRSDCGATCLRMVCRYYGKHFSAATMQRLTACGHEGTSFFELKQAAEALGMEAYATRLTWDDLKEVGKPCILHWGGNHFVVLTRIRKNLWTRKTEATVIDPGHGFLHYNEADFRKHWQKDRLEGFALLLVPTERFGQQQGEQEISLRWRDLLEHVMPHRTALAGVLVTLGVGGLLGMVFPFLTQAMIDRGIEAKNLNVIWLLLLAQLMLSLGQLGNDLLRGWLTLKCTSQISISFIHRFLSKLTRLPLSFFETRNAGDIMQRISDNSRIQTFITNTIVSTGISLVFFVIYSGLMHEFGGSLFGVFLLGAVVYIGWTVLFLKKRREMDAKRFRNHADNQSNLIQLVNGMPDIKLNNCGKAKVEEWHFIQQKIFTTNLQTRTLENIQTTGATFIDQVKNLVISYMAARLVVEGQLTLGEMVSIQYILGQMNAPLKRITGMIQEIQDTKISMERLGDIYNREDEEPAGVKYACRPPEQADIVLKDVGFHYPSSSVEVLKHVDVTIPAGKVTAIVGTSGCGKSTLMKLLLGSHAPTCGEVLLGGRRLQEYRLTSWRECCGVAMADGYIFSDTIAGNVAMGRDDCHIDSVKYACETACIQDFVESLPLGYDTKIGIDGDGLSSGQKQRILLARAVYHLPSYIFLDEATNALDSHTEQEVIRGMRHNDLYGDRTVVMVAHRLSTIRCADFIIVMENGGVAEQGTHEELLAKQGAYYRLVKNQLAAS